MVELDFMSMELPYGVGGNSYYYREHSCSELMPLKTYLEVMNLYKWWMKMERYMCFMGDVIAPQDVVSTQAFYHLWIKVRRLGFLVILKWVVRQKVKVRKNEIMSQKDTEDEDNYELEKDSDDDRAWFEGQVNIYIGHGCAALNEVEGSCDDGSCDDLRSIDSSSDEEGKRTHEMKHPGF
ncbi:hypothetical protein Dimus_023097 [Dionaea muscipula]